jgi:Amt family ammonium transporter
MILLRRGGLGVWPRCLGLALLMMAVTGPMPVWGQEDANAPPVAEAAADQIVAEAEEEKAELSAEGVLADVDVLWTCLAAFLVFFMQAGFALVETGFTRAKNACNIIMKNALDFSIGTLAFWMVGFGLMFGATSGFIGTNGFFYEGGFANATMSESGEVTLGEPVPFDWAFLIFQTVFAATAATIVSGAMAERTKFSAYLVYSLLITIVVYPIFGSWCWGSLVSTTGSGWLEDKGFLDFAGSTVVHSVGAWCALAGAIVVGPRLGKYGPNGKVNAIPGHNIPLAALGVFILWLGWFGFNPGSTTAVGGGDFAKIAVVTNMAAVAGALSAMTVSWIMFKKPDPSITLNGALAGLVSITAGCDIISPGYAVLTGAIGGVLVVLAVLFFDRIRIDDPVGAISVHGVCGAWGTLAIGFFGAEVGLFTGGGVEQLGIQALGVGAGFAWAFTTSLIIFLAIKYTIGIRVSQEEEIQGLDIHEHGMYAYPLPLVVDPVVSGAAPSGSAVAGMSPAAKPAVEGA